MIDNSELHIENSASQILKEKILSFHYKPGFQLKEELIAKEFQLTRNQVRNAISDLVAEGLVVKYPNRGAFVTTLSMEEVDEIFEVREALEVKAAFLASRRASREELERIAHAIEKRERLFNGDKIRSFFIPEMDFHFEIVRLSKNKILKSIWGGLHTKLQLIRIQSAMAGDRFLEALKEHKEILSCINQDRPDKAQRLLLSHIQRAKSLYSIVPE
jgi:DNA-binding GntR family transcriptional regulator